MAGGGDRHTPMPSLVRLPGWLLARLSRRGKVALAVAAVVATGATTLIIAALIDTGDRQAAARERQEAKGAAAELRRLREDQRPRRAPLPGTAASPRSATTRAALERAVTRDVRTRVALGLLEGPVAGTSCEAIGAPDPAGGSAGYNCFTLSTTRRSNYTIESGYRFSARANTQAGSLVWCKRNPRPIHPDTAYFRTIPISRECLPAGH